MDSEQAFPGLPAASFVPISHQKTASAPQSDDTVRGLHTACFFLTSLALSAKL